jgi:formylglycine-generating enzyme required for sulfatase activity
MNVDTAKLRQFIQKFFNADELTIFLFDYFVTVSDDVTPTMPKSQQVQQLLDYCVRHGKMADLLAALHRERPSSFTPDDYVQGEKAHTAAPQPPAPITRNPRQIFISHAHQDAEVAQSLAHDLEAHGYDIWIAPDSIRPGEKWVEAINRGLEESGIFVLLLSPDAVASRWVNMETNVAITYTHDDEMQLYPLMLKACRLPALWRAFQHISLRGGYEPGVAQLLAAFEPAAEKQMEPKNFGQVFPPTVVVHAPPLEIRQANNFVDQKTGKEFVRIVAGDFLYGDDKKKLHLDEFCMAKTPVTNAEYARFVAEMNVEPPEHWQGKTPPADVADHPVVYVSWRDAKAYAAWAEMELPTEQQWEKAARGSDSRKYPWGDDWRENHCNTKESGIGKTTPVGHFSPDGDSPFGCVDMSGNVWEWTESPQSWDYSVLRGGSWNSNLSSARAAYRVNLDPGSRGFNYGFRVVVVRRPPSYDP